MKKTYIPTNFVTTQKTYTTMGSVTSTEGVPLFSCEGTDILYVAPFFKGDNHAAYCRVSDTTQYTAVINDVKQYLELVSLIGRLQGSELPEDRSVFLTDEESVADIEIKELVEQISSLASGLLITSEGRPHYKVHSIIEKHVPWVSIVKGESDSFGWLTGVIVTNKGRIVYG